MTTEILQLKRELLAAREHIRTMNEEHDAAKEELQASQEELLSSNEEFQSTNEELETAKEELQSTNEELTTTNDELSHRNRELADLNTQIREARDYAEAIVETVKEPLIVLDRRLRIMRANSAFYTCFKTTREATEDGLIHEVGSGEWNIPALRVLLDRILAHGTSFQDYEVATVFPEIGQKTMRLSGMSLGWAGHALILLAMEDVTVRENALSALKDSDRRKDEFLAMLAHELRNPLAPIRSALELWERGDASKAAEQQAQAILKRQLHKQVRLVDDLLDMARITSGTIALRQEPLDLVQTVRKAVESVRPLLDARQHVLVLALPEHLLVDGDATRLDQVITNLLSNAVKYTKPGGRIALTLERQGKNALLKIADNGVGIIPQLLPLVFDLFVQAERSLDRGQGGLGIGLTLVRRVVELHGGRVEAQSAGAGQGSTFTVRLPALPETASLPAAVEIEVTSSASLTSRRILIVDDNTDSAESSAMLFQLEGHEVRIAFDGETAIELTLAFRPQVVLLDIGLPGMDGYEVAQRLRELPETKQALLIAVSGYGGEQDQRRSKAAGFDHHVVKPASVDQLKALIAAHTGKMPSITDA